MYYAVLDLHKLAECNDKFGWVMVCDGDTKTGHVEKEDE